MVNILKGAPVVAALTEELAVRVEKLRARGVVPALAILRVGERPDDLAYERGAMKRAEKIDVAVRNVVLPADCTQGALFAAIDSIIADNSIHGCLMFRPLPKALDETAACARLSPKKDVDCVTTGSLVAVFSGKGAGFPPCTAQACMEILNHYGYDLTGKRVTVIGRSLVIGKPVSMLLQGKNATVTMCHTKTVDMPSVCRKAEILIAAAGKGGIVTADYTNPSQVILDVGINTDAAGNLCGDVDFASVEPVVAAITPVPGGVGTVTSTVLCKHVIEAAERAGQ